MAERDLLVEYGDFFIHFSVLVFLPLGVMRLLGTVTSPACARIRRRLEYRLLAVGSLPSLLSNPLRLIADLHVITGVAYIYNCHRLDVSWSCTVMLLATVLSIVAGDALTGLLQSAVPDDAPVKPLPAHALALEFALGVAVLSAALAYLAVLESQLLAVAVHFVVQVCFWHLFSALPGTVLYCGARAGYERVTQGAGPAQLRAYAGLDPAADPPEDQPRGPEHVPADFRDAWSEVLQCLHPGWRDELRVAAVSRGTRDVVRHFHDARGIRGWVWWWSDPTLMTGLLQGRLMLARQTAVAPVAVEQVKLRSEEDDDLRMLMVHGLPPLPVLERGWHHLGLHLRGVAGTESVRVAGADVELVHLEDYIAEGYGAESTRRWRLGEGTQLLVSHAGRHLLGSVGPAGDGDWALAMDWGKLELVSRGMLPDLELHPRTPRRERAGARRLLPAAPPPSPEALLSPK